LKGLVLAIRQSSLAIRLSVSLKVQHRVDEHLSHERNDIAGLHDAAPTDPGGNATNLAIAGNKPVVLDRHGEGSVIELPACPLDHDSILDCEDGRTKRSNQIATRVLPSFLTGRSKSSTAGLVTLDRNERERECHVITSSPIGSL
jgi:hypothetical protein